MLVLSLIYRKRLLPAAMLILLALAPLAGLANLSGSAWAWAEEMPAQRIQSGLAEQTDFELGGGSVGAVTADLKDRLEKDLKVRRPQDFAFIADLLELVEMDQVPLSLVNRCYLWARRQSVYPFQHFKNAVRLEARKIGVTI